MSLLLPHHAGKAARRSVSAHAVFNGDRLQGPESGQALRVNGVSVAMDETAREVNERQVLPSGGPRERFEQQRPITAPRRAYSFFGHKTDQSLRKPQIDGGRARRGRLGRRVRLGQSRSRRPHPDFEAVKEPINASLRFDEGIPQPTWGARRGRESRPLAGVTIDRATRDPWASPASSHSSMSRAPCSAATASARIATHRRTPAGRAGGARLDRRATPGFAGESRSLRLAAPGARSSSNPAV